MAASNAAVEMAALPFTPYPTNSPCGPSSTRKRICISGCEASRMARLDCTTAEKYPFCWK